MAIPTTPTWTATISAAMVSAGRLNVSFTEVSNMSARGAQDVKTELWAASRYDALLATETVVLVSTGTSAFALPPDYDHETAITIFDSTLRDRAQSGTATSLTMSADDPASDGDYIGAYIFLLANTGSGQYNQITQNISATKVLSLTHAWATTPDSTTDYLVAQWSWALTRYGDKLPIALKYRPSTYRIVGQALTLYPPPDRLYPCLLTYSPNLTMVDETRAIFLAWLKQRVALVKQGVKVQTMLVNDDDRYPAELQKWESMKLSYGAQNPIYGQVARSR